MRTHVVACGRASEVQRVRDFVSVRRYTSFRRLFNKRKQALPTIGRPAVVFATVSGDEFPTNGRTVIAARRSRLSMWTDAKRQQKPCLGGKKTHKSLAQPTPVAIRVPPHRWPAAVVNEKKSKRNNCCVYCFTACVSSNVLSVFFPRLLLRQRPRVWITLFCLHRTWERIRYRVVELRRFHTTTAVKPQPLGVFIDTRVTCFFVVDERRGKKARKQRRSAGGVKVCVRGGQHCCLRSVRHLASTGSRIRYGYGSSRNNDLPREGPSWWNRTSITSLPGTRYTTATPDTHGRYWRTF